MASTRRRPNTMRRPTSVAAKVWADGATEPATWLLEQTDSTAALQVAGGIAIEHYQSSTTTNGPVVSLIDTITAGINV